MKPEGRILAFSLNLVVVYFLFAGFEVAELIGKLQPDFEEDPKAD